MSEQTIIDLELDPVVEAIIKEISAEPKELEARQDIISREPFYFPSVGTTFVRITSRSGEKQKSYFIKRFNPEEYFQKPEKTVPWRRAKTKISPAQLEHIFLSAYRQQGCPVPLSHVVDDYTLVMEDCGVETLEEQLRGKDAGQQERIFAELVPSQVMIGIAGRHLTLSKEARESFPEYSIDKSFIRHFRYWRPAASQQEQDEFMSKTSPLREYKSLQTVIGDSSTFHILLSNSGKKVIDLERLKEWPQASEPAGLWFSPESVIGFEAMERLTRFFKKTEADVEGRKLEDEEVREYLRDLYKVAAVNCFTGASSMRELEMENPTIYDRFVERHAGFKNGLEIRKQKLGGLAIKYRINGLYAPKEREPLYAAANTLFDVISK